MDVSDRIKNMVSKASNGSKDQINKINSNSKSNGDEDDKGVRRMPRCHNPWLEVPASDNNIGIDIRRETHGSSSALHYPTSGDVISPLRALAAAVATDPR